MSKFLLKTGLTGALSTVSLLMLSPAAFAQGDSTLEEVVVTGFRGSLQQSLNIKREAVGAVDSIVAEDIAEFPDNNLAESLQRIPGVNIDRAGGEGRNITVRGLSSSFTRSLINGMEVTSTSGFTDASGGATNNRNFDYNTFDSDLFRQLTVKKTPDAMTEEGSLGATIELQTSRPLDFDDMTLKASAQLGYNENAQETDPRLSLVFADQYLDGTFGVLLGVTYSERSVVEEGASSVRWDNVNDFGTVLGLGAGTEFDYVNNTDPVNNPGPFRPRLPRYDYYTHNVKRTGVNLGLQFQPSDGLEFGIDALISKHEAERDERFIQGIMNNNGVNGASNLAAYTVDSANTMITASIENGRIHSESRQDEMTTDFSVITAYANVDLTDSFRMKALVGTSESEFDNSKQTSINLLRNGVNWSWDYSNGTRVPEFNFSTAATDLSGWGTASFRLRPQGVNNSFDNIKLDFEADINDALGLKFGLSSKEFEFDQWEYRRPATLPDGMGGTIPNGENNAGVTVVDTSLMELMNGGNATWATVNFDGYLAYVMANNPDAFIVEPRTANIWGVAEDTTSFYAQLDFETSIGDVPFRGNVGFRSIDTEQSSWSYGGGGLSSAIINSDPYSYDEILPSLNLAWETSEDVLVRFSWATVISRAGLGNLRPNANVSVSGGSRTITAGNPNLEPTKAKAFDLGIEYYFAEESMLSLTVFHKEIETFVQTFGETYTWDETGLGLDPAIAVAACLAGGQLPSECNATDAEWTFRAPFNAPGGDLYGFEVSYQQPFTFLPGFWSNFGVYTNFTYVDASLDYIDTSGNVIDTQNFLGLSKTSNNFTLYYEDDAFMGRVSLANRSGFLSQVPGRNNNNLEGSHGTTNLDASFAYTVSDQLKLSLEVLNITDEADDQWVDINGDRPSYYHQSGVQYYLGASFSL
ncbi:MAG: TonB-dependent receptor [Gammaproteobacteria bacterium]|nr:TonB-dependent receptor [Gammaproteobacteria bacterium]